MVVNKGCYAYFINNNKKALKSLDLGVAKMIDNSKPDCIILVRYSFDLFCKNRGGLGNWLRKLNKFK